MPPLLIQHDGYPVDFGSYDLEYDHEEGLVAVGANFYPETLISAYTSGLFPWFIQDKLPYWFCPDPRMVLFVDQLKISKSMRNVFNKNIFQYSCDTEFEQVISQCAYIERKGQQATWIDAHFKSAYIELHRLGYAHSFEVWSDRQLVGGLYGVGIGKVFFGESMFAKKDNASKAAFIQGVKFLNANGFEIIDCQVYSDHLSSLGAQNVDRKYFLAILKEHVLPSVLDGKNWKALFTKLITH